MLQIVKCNDQSCCKFHTNYLTYFPERFLLPSKPLKSMVDGLEISEGMFGSLSRAIFWAKYVDKCFDKFCPSLRKVGKKEKSTIKKGTCWKCGKYYSTIKVMNSHKRRCDGYEDESNNEEPDLMKVDEKSDIIGHSIGSSSWQVLTRGDRGEG